MKAKRLIITHLRSKIVLADNCRRSNLGMIWAHVSDVPLIHGMSNGMHGVSGHGTCNSHGCGNYFSQWTQTIGHAESCGGIKRADTDEFWQNEPRQKRNSWKINRLSACMETICRCKRAIGLVDAAVSDRRQKRNRWEINRL